MHHASTFGDGERTRWCSRTTPADRKKQTAHRSERKTVTTEPANSRRAGWAAAVDDRPPGSRRDVDAAASTVLTGTGQRRWIGGCIDATVRSVTRNSTAVITIHLNRSRLTPPDTGERRRNRYPCPPRDCEERNATRCRATPGATFDAVDRVADTVDLKRASSASTVANTAERRRHRRELPATTPAGSVSPNDSTSTQGDQYVSVQVNDRVDP